MGCSRSDVALLLDCSLRIQPLTFCQLFLHGSWPAQCLLGHWKLGTRKPNEQQYPGQISVFLRNQTLRLF
jgi:hypothetical protein